MASGGHSKACCTLPPAEANYTPIGEYIEVSGFKTYDDPITPFTADKTGPAKAKTAIVLIYDVFGFAPQTIQGADLLSHVKDGSAVYVPDFLRGSYVDPSWLPPDTEEKQKAFGAFFSGPANPGAAIEAIHGLVEAIRADNGPQTKLAALGLCWGAKVVAATSGSGTPWSVGAAAHPSLIDAKDAAAISIPYAVLASGDEDTGEVESFVKALQGPKLTQTYDSMPHGWMGARGDVSDPKAKADYEKGYTTVADFL
ncbi:hypothetical protein MMC10_000660 [Thelotrema lepadinum]|nr:hypothetical protein [Thelotrema lepadinum]